jgi:hypothetical protein
MRRRLGRCYRRDLRIACKPSWTSAIAGVLNLTLDKTAILREWFRILKPGGRLQVGDILVERAVPADALDDISLWTG